MLRRKFLKHSALLTIGASTAYFGFAHIREFYNSSNWPDADQPEKISSKLQADLDKLIDWLRNNGWAAHLHEALNVNLNLNGIALQKELLRKIDTSKLDTLRRNPASGYDDFTGEQLIQPGFPSYSLLYHSLASPRVRPQKHVWYPSLEQIDLLENYIYALISWEELKAIYKVKLEEDLVIAVFAYEYRPAFKTPHHEYADIVFSRTGIARIGEEPPHYDGINRCYTNKPANDKREASAAVVPARYGLFLAHKVSVDELTLIKEESHKGNDSKDDRNDRDKTFLQPLRKLFDNDLLIAGSPLQFEESHKSEKLNKISRTSGIITSPVRLISLCKTMSSG